MRLRINLVQGFTTSPDTPLVIMGQEYAISDGLYNGQSYVELELLAHELYSAKIDISLGEAKITYTLTDYVYNVLSGEAGEEEKMLVKSFFSYCYYAHAYYAAVNK